MMRIAKFARFSVVVAALAFSACNTVEGVGKDVKSAGEAVEKAAK